MTAKSNLPPAAISYLDELLYGKTDQDFGFSDMLDANNLAIKYADKKIPISDLPTAYRNNSLEFVNSLKFKKNHHDLEQLVGRITRLRNDDRMYKAISLLKTEFNDQQWCIFLSAALGAYYDFSTHRKRMENSKDIAKKIASSASKLRGLIGQFESLNIDNQPTEFVSIQKLLHVTPNNYELGNPDNEKWKQVKPTLLGDIHSPNKSAAREGNSAAVPPIFRIYLEELCRFFEYVDPDSEEAKGELQYAWDLAPTIQTLLSRLVISATIYKPAQTGIVGLATFSQKPNPKWEYMRAFGSILSEEPSIVFSAKVIRAMTDVANIIRNLEDDVMSPGEAGKALAEFRPPSAKKKK